MPNKIFYISDTHFCYKNAIKMDGRPFKNVNEMDKKMIDNWNSVVSDEDRVYILGDFCYTSPEMWENILKQLKGEKFLIKGDHDLWKIPDNVKEHFVGIKDYKEIEDNGRRVVLCHYPMPFNKYSKTENAVHLYGHLRNTPDEAQISEFRKYVSSENPAVKAVSYNCFCGFYDYTPVTLEQIEQKWKETEEA